MARRKPPTAERLYRRHQKERDALAPADRDHYVRLMLADPAIGSDRAYQLVERLGLSGPAYELLSAHLTAMARAAEAHAASAAAAEQKRKACRFESPHPERNAEILRPHQAGRSAGEIA